MFSQLTVAISSCVAVLSCNNSQLAAKSNFTITQSNSNIQQLSKRRSAINSGQDIPSSVLLAQGYKNFMTLRRTGLNNVYGNPIYELELYANGLKYSSLQTVSGRYNTQNRNRDLSGTEAPLPNSFYQVSSRSIPGTHREVGDLFLPIYPQFKTGRTDLGIHYDPSFERSIKEDGTAGCIALTNKSDLDLVLNYVARYQPQFLHVQI